jgi:hypothetical protein
VLNRLLSWQIEPLANRLEELQRATTEAVAQLESDRSVDLTGATSTPSPAPPTAPEPEMVSEGASQPVLETKDRV